MGKYEEKIPAWQLTRVRNKKWSMKQGIEAEKFILRHCWISVISRIRSWSLNFKSTKAESYSEVTLWKMIKDHTQYLLNKDHQHHRWQLQKSWDIISRLPRCAGQATDAVSAYDPGQNGRCTDVIENSKVRMSRFLDTSTKTRMAKIMVQYGRHSCSSWTKSVWSPFGRTVMGKAIWESPIWSTWLWENSKLGMSLCTSWKRIILICVCGWHKIGWKETKSWSDVETTQQRNRFGTTDIFPWSCILGLHSKTMWNKQRYCGQLQNHVWIRNFRGENWKITMLGKSVYLCVVLRYGRSCQEMCGTMLWVGRQDDSTTLQSLYSHASMTTTFKRRARILWIITKVYSNQGFRLVHYQKQKATAKLDPETITTTQQFYNFTMLRRHAWMTINLKKKKLVQLENCLQFAHTLL